MKKEVGKSEEYGREKVREREGEIELKEREDVKREKGEKRCSIVSQR